jgi:8-oxo-dGTP pyrophosphatase MutT (NUDIX family)
MKKPAIRPKDAATLVLLRHDGGAPLVLMGQRHSGHRFMPDRYVFPGGRVDRGDSYVRPARPLRREVARRLGRSATPRRAQALAAAAVRETFEETGLVLGCPLAAPSRRPPAGWRHFFDAGFAPALDGLDYICRAVTPPFRPLRFNTRFFLADGAPLEGHLRGNGELVDLGWVPLDKAKALPIPAITLYVLQLVEELIASAPAARGERRVPLYHYLYGKHRLDYE